MAEVTFTKQFLAQLDARSVKLSSDWVGDARKLPAQAPFTFPSPPVPFPKSTSGARSSNYVAAGAATPATQPITVILKPLRGNATTVSQISISASIYELKARCAKQTGYAIDKIKILWERRPVPDAKLLIEVVGQSITDPLELGVMFVGQPTQTVHTGDQDPATSKRPAAQPLNGIDAIQSPAFWRDLEAFVVQRLQDERLGKEAVELWKKTSIGTITHNA